MDLPTRTLQKAVDEIANLPGIGEATALRLALHMLKRPPHYTEALSEALTSLVKDSKYCQNCFQPSDADICEICASEKRNSSQICVVEEITDLLAIENTHSYKGVYHVLGGKIAPIEGVGPEQLRISELQKRCEKLNSGEIIFALSSTIEGDTTAFYIYKQLKDLNFDFYSLARGVGIGDELQYTNSLTLAQSLENKQPYSG